VDTITLGAFARSGNHYFQHLVQTALIGVRCDWLSHRISDWDNKPNPVTIVRHPLDSVSSWIATTGDQRTDRAEKVLEWYVAYQKIIKLKQIPAIRFDRLIANPLGELNNLCSFYGLARSFFSSNDTLAAAMRSETDFVWANEDKSNYPVIQQEISSNGLFPEAVGLFEDLCGLTNG